MFPDRPFTTDSQVTATNGQLAAEMLGVQHLGITQRLRDTETVNEGLCVRAQRAASIVDTPRDCLGSNGG
jgi:hypothetical protein